MIIEEEEEFVSVTTEEIFQKRKARVSIKEKEIEKEAKNKKKEEE